MKEAISNEVSNCLKVGASDGAGRSGHGKFLSGVSIHFSYV